MGDRGAMNNPFAVVVGIHWVAVVCYVVATVLNCYGLIFDKQKMEKAGYWAAVAGLLVHGGGLITWWRIVGHGPYMDRFEVCSSDAWIILVMFLVFSKFFSKIKIASFFIFPSTFLLIALGLFSSPQVRKLPPTLRSIWLILHITFYKIAVATFLIALVFSIFYLLKKRTTLAWLEKLPSQEMMDVFAYRFAGFGFTFWAIGMLAGSIWAYQSWGRFWGWDPVETWSLITWIAFGLYLHLRRFAGWKEEKAAYLLIVCFILSLVTSFFIPLLDSSIHSQYFR